MTRSTGRTPSNVDIVVVALYLRGGTVKKAHTEDIALDAYRLAPAQFSWRKYPKYPDKEIARIALMDAAKPDKGQLVEGRAGRSAKGKEVDGWQLTPEGAKWAALNSDRIQAELRVGTNRPQHRDIDRTCAEARRSVLFQKLKERGTLEGVTQYEFTDFLGCSPDALPHIILKRFKRIYAAAEATQDEELRRFLDACRSHFATVFQE